MFISLQLILKAYSIRINCARNITNILHLKSYFFRQGLVAAVIQQFCLLKSHYQFSAVKSAIANSRWRYSHSRVCQALVWSIKLGYKSNGTLIIYLCFKSFKLQCIVNSWGSVANKHKKVVYLLKLKSLSYCN